MRKSLLVKLLILFCICCAGMSRMHIGTINEDPSRYSNEKVVVRGEVVQIFALPFIDQGICRLSDGTGEIWVKPAGRVPDKGESITIRGTVKVGLTFANKSFGVIIVEDKPEEE